MTPVTSQPLSLKLKEAGIKQDSEFYWYWWNEHEEDAEVFVNSEGQLGKVTQDMENRCSAFLASESLDELPYRIKVQDTSYFLRVYKYNDGDWCCIYDTPRRKTAVSFSHKSLAEAAGEMRLWAKERGYLGFTKPTTWPKKEGII